MGLQKLYDLSRNDIFQLISQNGARAQAGASRNRSAQITKRTAKMASALQAQLAQIAAKSSNSLDLKAQKKAHSQSLLFEPRVAATQDFDTIYQICYEGFQELCLLDSRFMSFARNIFSEQSKQEDRTQMTAAQNSELDEVLEDFLGLVGARLLLKPAQKAVEWLIRRFKSVFNPTAGHATRNGQRADTLTMFIHLGPTNKIH